LGRYDTLKPEAGAREQHSWQALPRAEIFAALFLEGTKPPPKGGTEEGSMNSARRLVLSLCVILSAVVLTANAAPASDFTGAFSLGAPSAAGENVQVTISLTITNNTGTDVPNAVVALHEPKAARVIYGRLTGLALPAGSGAQVNGFFTVPRDLYDSWKKGSAPAMSVNFTDAKGNPVRTFIEF
jgi:hypothetical protein